LVGYQNALRRNDKGWTFESTADLVRLLRIPGTINHRYGIEVTILEKSEARYNPCDFEPYLIETSRPGIPAGENPLWGVIEQCAFLRHCRDNAPTLPEPYWWAMTCALSWEFKSSQVIHKLSEPYSNYTWDETEAKIRRAQDSQDGPMRCETIREKTGFPDCPPGGCGVTTPVQLKKGIESKVVMLLKHWRKNKTLFSNEREQREQSPDEDETLDYMGWPNWPQLDGNTLTGLVGSFVELASAHSEAGPAALLMTFLCGVGVEFGTRAHFMVGDSKHHPRLLPAIVGASAKSRKGTSGGQVERACKFEHLLSTDTNL
jgi:hypothetical protein